MAIRMAIRMAIGISDSYDTAHALAAVGARTDVDDGQALVRQHAVLVHVDAAPVRAAMTKSADNSRDEAR